MSCEEGCTSENARGFRGARSALCSRRGVCAPTTWERVYSFMPWWIEGARIASGYVYNLPFALNNRTSWPSRLRHLKSYGAWCRDAIIDHRRYYRELRRELGSLGLDDKLQSIDHHTSHATSAYLTTFSTLYDHPLLVRRGRHDPSPLHSSRHQRFTTSATPSLFLFYARLQWFGVSRLAAEEKSRAGVLR